MIEQEILGCILKDNTLIHDTTIQSNYFEDNINKQVFESMRELAIKNESIDKVTLLSANYGKGNNVISYVTQLESMGNINHFETYEKQLIDQYKRNESQRIAQEWLSDSGRTIGNIIDNMQNLDELNQDDAALKNDILKDLFEAPFEENAEKEYSTGFSNLDKVLGGFEKQTSYIVGARPSMGKSALMLQFVLSVLKSNVHPIVFSLEMSQESLLRRLISIVGNINLFISRNPNELNESKRQAWQEAIAKLYDMEFTIFDNASESIQSMRSKIRKIKKDGKDVAVFVDYLTLISTTGDFYSDHSRISFISKRLKGIAKDYDCPVVTLAQLSRSLEQRQDKRPMLSDLRESGSIEEDADVIIFLYRDSYYTKDEDNNELELNVAKNRNGPTGKASLFYRKETGRMGDLETERGFGPKH